MSFHAVVSVYVPASKFPLLISTPVTGLGPNLTTSFYLNFLLKDPISKQSHILRFWILEPQLMNFWRTQFSLSQPWSFRISELLFSLSSSFLLSGLFILEWRNKEEGVQSQWRPRRWLHHRSGVDALSHLPIRTGPAERGPHGLASGPASSAAARSSQKQWTRISL